MTARLQKELTLTLGQLLTICAVCILPGISAITVVVSRLTALETWKTEHVASDEKEKAAIVASLKEQKEQVGVANETLTKVRVSIGRLVPATTE